ncbi:divergent polysaccharide deacetylase family protein [Microbulbifer sp. S227A]|uniref:divergent polysaccharide deacetylase family protein n=1 Tax=Microbulbifer sp. S227A TaxID=3415131 RepID=UPI003C7BD9F0
MRGFLGGIVLGLPLCGVGLAALSVWSPLAPVPELMPATVQPKLPASAGLGIAGAIPDPVERHDPPVSPAAQPSQTGDVAGIAAIESRVADHPQAGITAAAPVAPEAAATPLLPAQSETGAVDNPASAAPVATPQVPDQEAAVGADMAEPPVVAALDGLGGADRLFADGGDRPATPDVKATRDPAISAVAPVTVAPETNADPAPDAAAGSAPIPEIAGLPHLSTPVGATAPAVPRAFAQAANVPVPPLAIAPELEAVTRVSDQPDRGLPRIAPLPQAGVKSNVTGPTIGTPVIPLTERHKAAPAPAGDAGQAADLPPLAQYAEPFENAGAVPLMSIVLVDDGDAAGGDALLGLPFPVSVAVDPAMPDANARMARYRAAGHEVLALVEMPKFATARDVEISLAASFDILPETVAVLEHESVQTGRDVAAQLVAAVNGSGRGLVTRNVGLNSSLRLAQGDGAPVSAVFRDVDRTGQDAAAIERNLDQAVFRASQDGSVTVTGRLEPDTVRILRAWVDDHRASRVALAPVSAVLRLGGNPS